MARPGFAGVLTWPLRINAGVRAGISAGINTRTSAANAVTITSPASRPYVLELHILIASFHFNLPHFNLSATFEMPDIAQTSSLSPPTAPLTPMAPMVSLPALIGTPPATPVVPSILGIGDPKVDPQAFAASPDVFHRDANVSAV